LNLAGYSGTTLDVCWLGNSDLFFNYFDGANISNWVLSGGVSGQGVLCPGSACFSGPANVEGVTYANSVPASCTSLGSGYNGYRFSIGSGVSSGTLQRGISLVPLNHDVSLVAQNPSGAFTQLLGYRVTSKGELLDNATIKTTKTITVTRSLPYLSSNLLFGLFADTGIVSRDSYMSVPMDPSCIPTNSTGCSFNSDCCDWPSAECLGGMCVLPFSACVEDGSPCNISTNCCSSCIGGRCGGVSAD
jgi:hypothetical protein